MSHVRTRARNPASPPGARSWAPAHLEIPRRLRGGWRESSGAWRGGGARRTCWRERAREAPPPPASKACALAGSGWSYPGKRWGLSRALDFRCLLGRAAEGRGSGDFLDPAPSPASGLWSGPQGPERGGASVLAWAGRPGPTAPSVDLLRNCVNPLGLLPHTWQEKVASTGLRKGRARPGTS